jgi:hypothetical protein
MQTWTMAVIIDAGSQCADLKEYNVTFANAVKER